MHTVLHIFGNKKPLLPKIDIFYVDLFKIGAEYENYAFRQSN